MLYPISKKFTGKATVIPYNSNEKHSAISKEDTVVLSIPNSLNHRPIYKN